MPSERTGRIDRHGRKWRLQVKVHGERIRRSFDTREEAESALAAILADVERDAAADLARRLGRLTVADLVRLYYERRTPDLEASTCARYEHVMEKYILPGFGHHDVRDVVATPMILEDWIGTVAWGSARKALEVIGPAFHMAHLNGLIDSNPVERIRRPKAANRKRKKEIPTPEEVEKIVIAAYEQGGVWWGYFVELTAVLGLRRAETCALRWEDFTFPASEDDPVGRIRVVRAVGKMDGGTYIKLPKGGIEREVLVDRSLYDGLGYFDGKEGWLFPGRDVLPRRDPTRLTPTSTAGRLVLLLDERGGELSWLPGTGGSRGQARHQHEQRVDVRGQSLPRGRRLHRARHQRATHVPPLAHRSGP